MGEEACGGPPELKGLSLGQVLLPWTVVSSSVKGEGWSVPLGTLS